MRRTRFAALLLAALMLAGLLAGCAPKAEPQPYEAPVRAFEAMLNNADATWSDAVQAAVGDFCGEELTRIAELMIRTGITTDEIMTERMLGEYRAVYGYDCSFSFKITEAEPMDDELLQHYRDQLQYDSDFFAKNLQELQQNGAVDWESGLPLEDTSEMETLCTTRRDRLAAGEISEGYVHKLIVKVTGGELTEPEQSEDTMDVVCVDGVWVIADVFDNSYTS